MNDLSELAKTSHDLLQGGLTELKGKLGLPTEIKQINSDKGKIAINTEFGQQADHAIKKIGGMVDHYVC